LCVAHTTDGAGLDQIELSLGRSSIRMAGQQFGVEQAMTDVPCDHLGMMAKWPVGPGVDVKSSEAFCLDEG
jgi:hypothetical protein